MHRTFGIMGKAVTASLDAASPHPATLPADAGDVLRLPASRAASMARRLRAAGRTADLRIGYAGNIVPGVLTDYVELACAADGMAVESHVGAHGQEMQEVLSADSALRRFAPNLLVLAVSLRVLAPRLVHAYPTVPEEERRAAFDRILDHVLGWVRAARRETEATLLVANFPVPGHPAAGIADLRDPLGEVEFVQRLNLDLLVRLRGEPRAFLLDLDRVAARYGKDAAFDERLARLARIEWRDGFAAELALEIRRYARAALGRARKCLVLDLDGTLWGGVLGEDGPAGLRIGPGSPEGEAFLAVQHAALALRARGVLLAVCSKNDPADVAAVLAEHPEMALRPADFSAMEVGWHLKPEGLRRIARTLGIGLDALVFVDDNPAECAQVRAALPEVRVVQLGPDPAEHAGLIRRLDAFETLAVTGLDAVRADAYRIDRERAAMRADAGSLDDYLAGLETRVRIRPATAADVARVHQLINKTNQFNLTVERFTPGAVETFLDTGRFDLRVTEVEDRFGRLGLVGVTLVERGAEGPHVRLFLLSCRALGRRVEVTMANALKRRWLGPDGAAALTARYRPAPRNQPVADFYEARGFTVTEVLGDGGKTCRLAAADAVIEDCGAVEVEEME
ncbi:MAG TPA: HAD-IIIC family phosphatase [Azospirillum sp.]